MQVHLQKYDQKCCVRCFRDREDRKEGEDLAWAALPVSDVSGWILNTPLFMCLPRTSGQLAQCTQARGFIEKGSLLLRNWEQYSGLINKCMQPSLLYLKMFHTTVKPSFRIFEWFQKCLRLQCFWLGLQSGGKFWINLRNLSINFQLE